MDDFDSMPSTEMFARRDAAEKEISGLIGQFVFTYSRLVTGLHLCVAWHDEGKGLKKHAATAQDLGVSYLLRSIDKQARRTLGANSNGFKAYKNWLRRAHQIRETRNLLMHSRWGIEAFGRYAIAVTTPVLVEPVVERTFTADQLRFACQACEKLGTELNRLRQDHPL